MAYEDSQSDLRTKLRATYAIAEKAPRSKSAAIKLFCIECMGGSTREAKLCPVTDCFLYPHAYRRGGGVPTNRGKHLKKDKTDDKE